MINGLYEIHGEHLPWIKESMPEEILAFIKNHSNGGGGNLLDVGCGYGKLLSLIEGLNIGYVGIDISERAIAYCKESYPAYSDVFLHKNILDFTPTNPFDFVIDIGCLHMNDGASADLILEKYIGILEKGGYLCLRFFENSKSGSPIFFIDQVPIYGCNTNLLLKKFMEKFHVKNIFIDSSHFELCNRTTLILEKIH